MSRAGRKAFARCDVKVVEFNRRYRTHDETRLVVNEEERVPEKNYSINGYGVILRCPRTEDDEISIRSDRDSHPSQIEALNSIKSVVGKLLCAECRYSHMTPVQVSVARTEFAKAEAERLEAYGALELARKEVAELPPGFPATD